MHLPKVTLLLVAAGLGGLAIIAVWQMRPAAAPAAVVATSPLPLAQPGPAWGLVQQRLGQGLDTLDLPAAGLRVDLVVTLGTNGMISATRAQVAGTAAPAAVTAHILAATKSVPFALAGAPGQYRLWLQLKPAQPAPELGEI
jgi:hypothetical protein